MREATITTSAQFDTSRVRELKNRGRLKCSNGFRGMFFVVLGSLPCRKAMAAVKAMNDPVM